MSMSASAWNQHQSGPVTRESTRCPMDGNQWNVPMKRLEGVEDSDTVTSPVPHQMSQRPQRASNTALRNPIYIARSPPASGGQSRVAAFFRNRREVIRTIHSPMRGIAWFKTNIGRKAGKLTIDSGRS